MIETTQNYIIYCHQKKWIELDVVRYNTTNTLMQAESTLLLPPDFYENQAPRPIILSHYTAFEKEVLKKLLIDNATDLIENGKLDRTIKLLKIHFKEEDNKDLLFKTILLSQQLNSAKEHFELGLMDNHDQKVEYARITKALLSLIWDAEEE